MNFIFKGWKSKGPKKNTSLFAKAPPPRINKIEMSRQGELNIAFDQEVIIPDFIKESETKSGSDKNR